MERRDTAMKARQFFRKQSGQETYEAGEGFDYATVGSAFAAQRTPKNVNPSHNDLGWTELEPITNPESFRGCSDQLQGAGLGGTRTRNQRLKRALLYH